MGKHTGSPLRNRPEEVEQRIALWRELGRNTSEAARTLNISRGTMQGTIRFAYSEGLISEEEMRPANTPQPMAYEDAMTRKRQRFSEKVAKGNWRKPTLIHVAPGPFILKVFGDPHLDSDGCDVDLFAREWLRMDESKAVYGLCVGDWFNNWVRSLSHLWKGDGDPSDAWTIFEHLMEERGAAMLASCSGNHDDWTHAPYDPIELKMRQYGVRYRMGAISCAIYNGTDTYSVAMRHKWRGSSMYSAAHGLVRGARHGWNDDLLIGGHIHQTEIRHHVAADGAVSLLVQIEAFKRFDDYADVHGFMGPTISPVVNIVVDPRRPKTDPDRSRAIWDHDEAVATLERLRREHTV